MLKQRYMIVAALLTVSYIAADNRQAYIINNTTGTIVIKGPTKATNKVVIPSELNVGATAIKNIDKEGTAADTLDLTIASTSSQVLKKYSRKYPKSTVIIINDDPAQGFAVQQTDTLTPATITDATSF